MILEVAEQRLIIDPGMFTLPLGDLDDVSAVVITHEHSDHWTAEQLQRIIDRNPDVAIYGPAGVAAAAAAFTIIESAHGAAVEVGPFALRFFGDKHAVIHESIPVIDNVGVLVNDMLYYAGDALIVPPVEVEILAAPAGAPWLKIAEAMDYVLAVKAKRVFPVHEMVLSVFGKQLSNDRLRWAAEHAGGSYFVLEPGESLDL